MKVSTFIGCIPLVGSVVGIGRIAIASNKAQEYRTGHATASIFDSYSITGGLEETFHGMCEIVPIFGPLFYGITQLFLSIMNLLAGPQPEVAPELNPPETEGKKEFISIQGIQNCSALKQFIGQKIKITVTRYAIDHFKDNSRNYHGYISNYAVVGVLQDIKDAASSNDRHAIQILGHHPPGDYGVHSYYLTDEELARCNE